MIATRAAVRVDGGAQAFTFTLLSGLDAPLTARQATADRIDAWLPEGQRFKLDLLLTELVTNAVQHGIASAIAAITVEGAVYGDVLHVDVTNDGRPLEYEVGLPDALAEGGRGLALVDALSTRWGSVHENGHTTVWFELETGIGANGSAAA